MWSLGGLALQILVVFVCNDQGQVYFAKRKKEKKKKKKEFYSSKMLLKLGCQFTTTYMLLVMSNLAGVCNLEK